MGVLTYTKTVPQSSLVHSKNVGVLYHVQAIQYDQKQFRLVYIGLFFGEIEIKLWMRKIFKQVALNYFTSFLYVCMVNTIYLFSFVETPRKFIIAELSIRKLESSSVLHQYY